MIAEALKFGETSSIDPHFVRTHVILEGPDGAGKTTLAQRLRVDFGYTYHHQGPPAHQNMLVQYALAFLNATAKGGPCVFDRLHIGESVYGPILRGRDRVGGNLGLNLLDLLITAKGGKTFLCIPPIDAIKKTWLHRRETELVKEFHQIESVYNSYLKFVERYPIVNYMIQESIDKMILSITNDAICLDGDFIGSPFGNFVFVGDMANQDLDLPFFATTGSSRFLWDCLHASGFAPREITLTNSRNPDGEPRDKKYWLKTLPPLSRTIVCLGKEAYKLVREALPLPYDVGICVMDHPQYVKRFHSRKVTDYVAAFEFIRESAPTEGIHRYQLR